MKGTEKVDDWGRKGDGNPGRKDDRTRGRMRGHGGQHGRGALKHRRRRARAGEDERAGKARAVDN
jgi:hypothetical protein